jgi:drug/metabolite transporter (DMT)-like permease
MQGLILSSFFWTYALVLGAVLCEGLFILLQKRLRAPVPPLALSTLMCAIGLAVCLPASLAEAPWTLALSAEALLAVAYYALVPTVAGFVLWYAGAERVAGSEAALFTAIAPVSAVLLAALLLDESMSARQLAGMACVLGAVLILGRTRKPATVAR